MNFLQGDIRKVDGNKDNEEGEELAESDTKKDAVGSSYTTSPRTISGYTLKTTPDNATGTYTAEDITVTYVYALTVTTKQLEKCTMELEYTTTTYTGSACTPSVTVKDQDIALKAGIDYEVSYNNNVNVGTATVTISGKGDYTGSVNKNFTITEPVLVKGKVIVKYVDESGQELADSETLNGAAGETYTTSAKTIDGYTLKTTPSNATGTYTQEDITVSYVYAADTAVRDLADCIIELEYTVTTYTGSACTPSVTVKDQDIALKAGIDYEVSYNNNVNVGTATVTISGKGGYTGSVSKSFTITESQQKGDEQSSESDTTKAVDAVKNKIAAIGNVTLNSEAAIKTAREEYEKLTESQKTLVENYTDLQLAEQEYARLKAEQKTESDQSPDEGSASHSESSTATTQAQQDKSQTASEQKTQGDTTQGDTTQGDTTPGDTTPAQPASAVTASTTQAATETKAKDHPTSVNLKNKKTYKKTTKVKIKDSDGIKGIKLNSKKLTIKAGKKSVSFKLSQYKKYLKKKGKWNKLVVTDMNGNKKTIQFKVK